MAGKRLLIIGGAGFLGYYLVQSVLHWNKRKAGAPIQLTVYDNYIRGMPEWLKRWTAIADLRLVKHDITHPLPADIPDFHFIIHWRVDRVADLLSAVSDRDHGRQCRRPAHPARLREGAPELAHPGGSLPLLLQQRDLRRPDAREHPDAETYRGNVSCTGARSCYDESKRFGETLCVFFTQQHKAAHKVARPFNNYGPGLKITDTRVLPDFARDVLAGRDIIMKSSGSPRRTFCYVADAVIGYYKVLVKGHAGEAYNIGVETPEISVAELADRVVALGRELWGYAGKIVKASTRTTWPIIPNAAAPSSPRPGPISATTRRCSWTRACGDH